MSNKDDLLSKTTNSFHEVNFKREVINSRLKVFTVAELKITTRNFSNDMIAGEGAFGKVFKGWVEHETFAPSKVAFGMAVAVKKLNTDGYQGFEEWQVVYMHDFLHLVSLATCFCLTSYFVLMCCIINCSC